METVRAIKKAFLIGVSDYGNPQQSDLLGCKTDVTILSEVLRRKGFQCMEWVDRPLDQLLPNGELKRFYEGAVNPADTILFYFSGHGVDIGEQILLGPGVKSASLTSGLTIGTHLALATVLDELSKYPAQKIVVIDACRVTQYGEGLEHSLQKSRRKAIQSLSNCAVIYASADGTESYMTPTNDSSRFTFSLARELRKYGRGLLSIIEATMERVAAYPDGKSQTPWIYASLRDRPLDGYRVEEEKLVQTHFPKHIGTTAGGEAWAVLSGSGALTKYDDGAFAHKARLPASLLASTYSFHPHPRGNKFIFVKGLSSSVHQAIVSPAGATWETRAVLVKHAKVGGMMRLFGAWWSPAGEHLTAFGTPLPGQIGAALWSTASGTWRRQPVGGLPSDLEINSATWINETQLLVAGSRDASSRSNVFLLERQDEAWKAYFFWQSSNPLRVTSMLVAKDQNHVYLGADDGSVAMGILSQSNQPTFLPREHPTTGFTSLALLPWKGRSRHYDSVEIGVCAMAFDQTSHVLGLTYYDGTAAFWDPVLGTYIKAISLPRSARRPAIVLTAPGLFLCGDGEKGRLFKIVAH